MIRPDTQAGRLLMHLQSGNTINRLSALIELGIFELSARVIDLEKDSWIIVKKRVQVINRFQEKTSVTEYSLDATQLLKLAA